MMKVYSRQDNHVSHQKTNLANRIELRLTHFEIMKRLSRRMWKISTSKKKKIEFFRTQLTFLYHAKLRKGFPKILELRPCTFAWSLSIVEIVSRRKLLSVFIRNRTILKNFQHFYRFFLLKRHPILILPTPQILYRYKCLYPKDPHEVLKLFSVSVLTRSWKATIRTKNFFRTLSKKAICLSRISLNFNIRWVRWYHIQRRKLFSFNNFGPFMFVTKLRFWRYGTGFICDVRTICLCSFALFLIIVGVAWWKKVVMYLVNTNL